jgi:hypothetical protein
VARDRSTSFVEPGPRSLRADLHDEYAYARATLPGWYDAGTYNPLATLPGGGPSDHSVYPARAFDAGFKPAIGWLNLRARRVFNWLTSRPDINYVILGDRIWSRARGLHAYTDAPASDHAGHIHASGLPDPVSKGAAERGSGSRRPSYLQELWINAGGAVSLAPTMEAIALAESRGNPQAHAVTSREDSRGLWQINVRAHPELAGWNLYSPQTNARAAVHVHRKQGLGAWSTYTSGAYHAHMGGFTSPSPPPRVRPEGDDDGGVFGFVGGIWGAAEGTAEWAWRQSFGRAGDMVSLLKTALWFLSPRNWLRAVEFVVGTWLLILGLGGLVLVFLARDPEVRRAAESAAGFRFGKAAAIGGIAARRASSPKRQERAAARAEEQRQARERGRRRARTEEGEKRLRRDYPDYDVIPF